MRARRLQNAFVADPHTLSELDAPPPMKPHPQGASAGRERDPGGSGSSVPETGFRSSALVRVPEPPQPAARRYRRCDRSAVCPDTRESPADGATRTRARAAPASPIVSRSRRTACSAMSGGTPRRAHRGQRRGPTAPRCAAWSLRPCGPRRGSPTALAFHARDSREPGITELCRRLGWLRLPAVARRPRPGTLAALSDSTVTTIDRLRSHSSGVPDACLSSARLRSVTYLPARRHLDDLRRLVALVDAPGGEVVRSQDHLQMLADGQ